MYRKFWEEISGEKVKETGLYFTDTKQWVVFRIRLVFLGLMGFLLLRFFLRTFRDFLIDLCDYGDCNKTRFLV